MKVRNILKGIGKLVLATSLMCGIGLFLCQDVKAFAGTITNTASGGDIKIKIETGTVSTTYKFYLTGAEASGDEIGEITTDASGNGEMSSTISKDDILTKAAAIPAKGNVVIRCKEGAGSAEDTTIKTNQIDVLEFITDSGKLDTYDFREGTGKYIENNNKVYLYTGTEVIAKASPVTGYVISSWSKSGSSTYTESEDKCELKVTAAGDTTFTPTLDAKIAKITVDGNELPYTVTAKANNSSKTYTLLAKDVSGTSVTPVSFSVSPDEANNIKCEISGTNLKITAKEAATVDTTFTITAKKGSDTYSNQITVRPAKTLESVTINGATSGSGKGYLNTPFNLTGAVSPAGASVTYKWTVSGPGGSFANDTAQSTTYTPTAKGTHTITLTATDTLDSSNKKIAIYTLTVDDRSNKLTFDLQNPEVTVGYKNIVVAKVTEGSLNGFSDSDFKLTSTDTDKVSFESSTPTISGDGSTLTFIIEGKKASTDAKVSISGPSGVTVAYNNNTVKVYDLGSVDYNSSSRTLTVKMPDKVITGPNLKNNLKEVTGFKLKAYHGDEEIASLDKSGKNTTVTATELENIVTNNASKFSGETDSIWFKIIPYGTKKNGDKSEAKDNDDKVIAKNTDGIAVYRVQVSGENLQTTTTYGLQGQQVKVTATPNPGCTFEKWADGTTTPTKTITVSSTTANNNLTGKAVLGDRVPSSGGAGGSGGDTSGLDRVPKTAESNAPIWLIIVLVFAAMGGGYALYLQMRPVKEDSNTKDNN